MEVDPISSDEGEVQVEAEEMVEGEMENVEEAEDNLEEAENDVEEAEDNLEEAEDDVEEAEDNVEEDPVFTNTMYVWLEEYEARDGGIVKLRRRREQREEQENDYVIVLESPTNTHHVIVTVPNSENDAQPGSKRKFGGISSAYTVYHSTVMEETVAFANKLRSILTTIWNFKPGMTTHELQSTVTLVRERKNVGVLEVAAAIGMRTLIPALNLAANENLVQFGVVPSQPPLVELLQIALNHNQLNIASVIFEKMTQDVASVSANVLRNVLSERADGFTMKILQFLVQAAETAKQKGQGLEELIQILQSTDEANKSILHIVSKGSLDDVRTLLHLLNVIGLPDDAIKDFINLQDQRGETALHANLNNVKMMKLLLEVGADPNLGLAVGIKPIHSAILRKDVEALLLLLRFKADPDSRATFVGAKDFTPIMLVAKQISTKEDLTLLHILIMWNCQLDLQNASGTTTRHLLQKRSLLVDSATADLCLHSIHILDRLGGARCNAEQLGCGVHCSHNDVGTGKMPASWLPPVKDFSKTAYGSLVNSLQEMSKNLKPELSSKGGFLLSLDGGGILGINELQMLIIMEYEINKYFGEKKSLRFYFDWKAGVSTGAIIATALESGRTLIEIQSMYLEMKDRIFSGGLAQPIRTLRDVFENEFGDSLMSSLKKRTMVFSTNVKWAKPNREIIRSYRVTESEVNPESFPSNETTIVDALIMSVDAFPYFNVESGNHIDGAFSGNEASEDAVNEMLIVKADEKRMGSRRNDVGFDVPFVVSIGAGVQPRVPCGADIFKLDLTEVDTICKWITEYSQRSSAIAEFVANQMTHSPDEELLLKRRILANSSAGRPYVRFNPPLAEAVKINEVDVHKLSAMAVQTRAKMYEEPNRTMMKYILTGLEKIHGKPRERR